MHGSIFILMLISEGLQRQPGPLAGLLVEAEAVSLDAFNVLEIKFKIVVKFLAIKIAQVQ